MLHNTKHFIFQQGICFCIAKFSLPVKANSYYYAVNSKLQQF